MAIPCKSVDEAVQALDEQFGYTGEMLMDSINTLHSTWITLPELQKRREMIQWSKPNDPTTWDVDVEDALKDHRFGWGTYSNTATAASNLTMESLQKAIEDMRKLVKERIEVRMFDVWSDRPAEDQSTEESAPAGLESLADVLPDLYGRKEHAAYMARTARAEHAQNVGRKTAVQLHVRSLMDGLCGKHRGMED